MRYLLDANAVIALIKSADSVIARRARQYDPASVLISAIVTHELYFGAFKSVRVEENLARLGALRLEVIPFDKEDAIAAGNIRATLALAGTPIGPFDTLIAGQALCRGLTLVTANTREFSRVEGLRVEDWSASA